MSSIQGAKAISAVHNGRVSEREYARVFTVEGSTGTPYTVVLYARGHEHVCNCEAGHHGRRCWHIDAAKLLLAKERDERIAADEAAYAEAQS